MSLAAQPALEPGRAYRTKEFRRWSANPARLANRLVREGRILKAAHGLFYAPIETRFGQAPPLDTETLRGFLDSDDFVITGPPKWNDLKLGSTAMFASTLVYNRKRTGEFTIDARRFLLRRVLFPDNPPPEWFVIDLVQNHDMAGISLADLEDRIAMTLRQGLWSQKRLLEMADRYGTQATFSLVRRCLDDMSPLT